MPAGSAPGLDGNECICHQCRVHRYATKLIPELRFGAGHTSWSTSGLGFLSFWALGKLRAFDGSGHGWRLLAGLMPVSVAIWIGITRLQARSHNNIRGFLVVLCTGSSFAVCADLASRLLEISTTALLVSG